MMIGKIFAGFAENRSFFMGLLWSHLLITLASVGLAIVIGLMIGLLISEKSKLAGFIMGVVNVVYTIPSIALLGILISFTGIGNTTAIIALTVYGLLPVVRGTYTGITNIDPKIIEASKALGATRSQIMFKIKLPMAMPVIFSSIRNMVTMTIALAGIASFVGAGGLGVAVYRGITTNNKVLMLEGSILIAVMALVIDWILGLVERKMVSNSRSEKKKSRSRLPIIIGSIAVLLTVLIVSFTRKKGDVIRIASKPTTEGYVLAEIVGQVISKETGIKTEIANGVAGGTLNIHPAVVKGEFDMYTEYTGTSWQVVLKDGRAYSERYFPELKDRYEKEYRLTWKGMFGFNDTYGIGIRKELADRYDIKTYSDLARYSSEFTFGAEYDFFERNDGFKPLSEVYGFHFKSKLDMDNGLKYKALLSGKIDVMTVFTTDGQVSDERIKVLEDDKKFYPSYMAGMVVSENILKKYPRLGPALDKLNGLIDEDEMARMNLEVEAEGKSPAQAASDFLKKKGLLEE